MSTRLILALGLVGVALISAACVLSPWPWTAFVPPGVFLLYLFLTAEDASVQTPQD